MNEFYPIKLVPCCKNYLWGGTKLKKLYGKESYFATIAESWELACHPDGMSVAAEGRYAGKSLAWLGELDREHFWGTRCIGTDFPIMVKLIDAEKDLSIQVHPSEEKVKPGEHGKAEMWYVVDSEPHASIFLGFSRKITKDEFISRAHAGTICQILNRVPVSKGDVFYILPGTVHSIGAGLVIAEVQQNSNTTFRIYDYDRVDDSGRHRTLHIDRAAEVVSYEPIVPAECRANSRVMLPEFSMTELFSCRYFQTYRLDVRTEVRQRCDGHSFRHLLCVDGAGQISTGDGIYPFHRGNSYFLPAALGEYKIMGECNVLLSSV